MTPLCTVGYEGRAADEFVRFLVANGIQSVVDVRERPLSRKRGFSKGTLSEKLAEEGVEYVHLRDLGNPKEYRDALKQGWAFDEFTTQFRLLLESRTEALGRLRDVAVAGKTCLVCFEADPSRCHRSLVAEALAEAFDSDLEVVHLGHDC